MWRHEFVWAQTPAVFKPMIAVTTDLWNEQPNNDQISISDNDYDFVLTLTFRVSKQVQCNKHACLPHPEGINENGHNIQTPVR